MSQALIPSRLRLDPILKLRGKLIGLDGDDVNLVLSGLAHVSQSGATGHLLADNKRQQRIALLVLHNDLESHARGTHLERLGIRVHNAEFPLVALVVAGHLENLQPHQARGGRGHLVLGVGRIIVVRGDHPAGLAVRLDLLAPERAARWHCPRRTRRSPG